MIKENNKLLL